LNTIAHEYVVMKISVIGSGYVGTTLAACLADLGHDVVNVDIDESIVDRLNAGEPSIHEPGLAELVAAHAGPDSSGRLRATTDYAAVLDTDVTFLCLPTPSRSDGSIDLGIMSSAAGQLGETLARKAGRHTVIVKSTVVPGSTADTIGPLLADASGTRLGEDLGVGMNPEFLREGSAVQDCLEPDKLVFGADDETTLAVQRDVWAPVIERVDPAVVETGTRTAEMIKYANNAFLAGKLSLMNDIANICKLFDVDSYEVADAMGLDARIARSFLDSGLGWGGSCFPKDVAALIAAAREAGYDPSMLTAAVEVNDGQPGRLLDLLERHVDVAGERVAVLGVAFKPGTDDVRETRAQPVVAGLLDRGATVVAHDPVAADRFRESFPDLEVTFVDSPAAALDGAVACLVLTDWPVYAELDAEFDAMATPVVVDGRRVVTRRDGIVYEGLTW
jgi:UDPglucose 6-dehydrogenase